MASDTVDIIQSPGGIIGWHNINLGVCTHNGFLSWEIVIVYGSEGGNMLRRVEIAGFRGIEYLQLEDLAAINVLIGENNCGKTSVLEALQLLGSWDVLSNLYRISYRRENPASGLYTRNMLSAVDMILYSFNCRYNGEIRVVGEHWEGNYSKAEIYGEAFSFVPEENITYAEKDEDGFVNSFRGEYAFTMNERIERKVFDLSVDRAIIRARNRGALPIVYLSPSMVQMQMSSTKTMYNVMRSGERQELIELLRIFDKRVVGIDRAIRSGKAITFLELEDGDMMPISMFGDGVKKVLAVANAIMKVRGGIVLIDEFETGFHKSALKNVAEWLTQAAKKYDTQIFLTTHSGEVLDALLQASWESAEINTYRLEQYNGKTYVKKFNGDMLENDRMHWGMDIF